MTHTTRKIVIAWFLPAVLTVSLSAAFGEDFSRQSIFLDGTWQVAEGKLDIVPDVFSRTVSVPGLVDQAKPAFENVRQSAFKDPGRDAYWYRREFNLDSVAPYVRLKIHKAMFGTKVMLNGTDIGEHHPSFTPAYYDVTSALKRGKNEILIRVGADFQSVLHKAAIPYDIEKVAYIPGIFDSVELIGTEKLFIENIQTAPDIDAGKVNAQIRLVNKGSTSVRTSLNLTATEYKSGNKVGSTSVASVIVPPDTDVFINTSVTIEGCKLWTPESPFLYVFEAATESDHFTTRFGMRTFRFNPQTRLAELNGKPYFMRGSNFTVYRFFEDEERKSLPWNQDWVQRLHERVKQMHWNSLRYCIGFPPEFWYDIADEVGILIQDEFPIWMMNVNEANTWLDTDQLVAEYTDWMRERWNHPCVVIWDACNETACPKTGVALSKVRGLDLSNRPWDNGWSPPAMPGDVRECHPYHFQQPSFRMNRMPFVNKKLQGDKDPFGVINNEYGWLWLNRDGTPTTLTNTLYQGLLGPDSTREQRLYTYATYLAAETEWFRAHRQCAGVLHFTMLTYSRPGTGQTSDHWANVAKLEWEPFFFRYVRDSFSPVGLMLDYWNNYVTQGKDATVSVPVILFNDLEPPWKGTVKCRIMQADKIVWENEIQGSIEPYGTSTLTFEVALPQEAGAYRLEASIADNDQKPVASIRDFNVRDFSMIPLPIRDVCASSISHDRHSANRTLTADYSLFWFSAFQEDEAWIMFDLGEQKKVGQIIIHWGTAYTRKFDVAVSNDNKTWTEVFEQDNGLGGDETVKFDPVDCRFLRINCREKALKQYGHAIYFVEVFD